eukprot:TRINITY_DN4086_c2_g2_i2.p1 TRINITY_DN4086_c2_g2~~TRINITY_DN4086_c2_g2_i2.p1  ORF type:complete len:292 (-),score=22.00 TRINITY_DN4086_c2_g2_i2:198-1073(-)
MSLFNRPVSGYNQHQLQVQAFQTIFDQICNGLKQGYPPDTLFIMMSSSYPGLWIITNAQQESDGPRTAWVLDGFYMKPSNFEMPGNLAPVGCVQLAESILAKEPLWYLVPHQQKVSSLEGFLRTSAAMAIHANYVPFTGPHTSVMTTLMSAYGFSVSMSTVAKNCEITLQLNRELLNQDILVRMRCLNTKPSSTKLDDFPCLFKIIPGAPALNRERCWFEEQLGGPFVYEEHAWIHSNNSEIGVLLEKVQEAYMAAITRPGKQKKGEWVLEENDFRILHLEKRLSPKTMTL